MELTLRQKIGQLVLYSLDGCEMDASAVRTLRDYCVGNIIHFGNNIHGLDDTRALNAALTAEIRRSSADIPPLLCIDHEGGRVMRFAHDLTWFPSHLTLSAADDEALTHYLRAICLNRADDAVGAYEELKRSFEMDPSLEKIAHTDGDVNDLLLEQNK